MPSGERSSAVILGTLELTGLEVPSSYDRGGNVQAVVHRLVGGGRVVQLMGPDRVRRRLQGCFTGPLAAEKAQELEAIRDAGAPLVLAIGAWCELVVVTNVIVRYTARGSIIDYLLDAEPIFQPPAAALASFGSIVGAAVDDLAAGAAAIGLALGADPPAPVVGALGTAQSGLATASASLATVGGTGEIPALALSPASAALQAVIGAGGGTLAALASAAAPGDLVAGPSALSQATATALLVAGTVNAAAYATRAAGALNALQPASVA